MTDSPAPRPPSSYPLVRGLLVRMLGRCALAVGLAVVAVALARAASAPSWLLSVLTGLAGLLLAVSAGAAVLVLRPPTVLRLDADGFTVRWLRSAGVRSSRWRAVAGATTASSRHGPVLALRHTDGACTLVPLSVLAAPPVEVERDVHERLNGAHGYRRL
ncbi:MAG: hypothetical protein M3P83_05220 [Actinomycetota bacterium]|nr:hypothetical protein [Actinomycetota bacterium]